uniref:Merozoite surface protein 7 n=1 Tax=Plasmodium cynomolgi TaxID=5827 RepID=A0A1L2DW90_9APIC|nr:merozoite surface protein 7 [Plasmodium cynomolgi]
MKSGIVLVSCLLLLCAEPTLGEENKKENQNTYEEDTNYYSDEELKVLKGKLENLKLQFNDENALKQITEEQILMLKKKFEELKNKKSDHEAKLESRRGNTSPGDKDELIPSDYEFAGQSINDNDEVVMVSRSKGNDQGDKDSSVPAGETRSGNEAALSGSTSEEIVTEVTNGEDPSGQGSEPAAKASLRSDNYAELTNQPGSAVQNEKVNPTANVNHVDTLFDELLAEDNKKHMMDEGEHHSAYNNLRKQYDELSLNKTEYAISLKLLDTMLSSEKVGEKRKNALVEMFKKAMYDKEYSEKFKSLIYGVYLFAKRHNFLDEGKVKGEDYNKLFNYVGNLMNTLEL